MILRAIFQNLIIILMLPYNVLFHSADIGKTVKVKICVHTSQDIRAIASQLVNVWIEVFCKEKATGGGLKLLKHTAASISLKDRCKDQISGKMRFGNEATDTKGKLLVPSSKGSHSPSKY